MPAQRNGQVKPIDVYEAPGRVLQGGSRVRNVERGVLEMTHTRLTTYLLALAALMIALVPSGAAAETTTSLGGERLQGTGPATIDCTRLEANFEVSGIATGPYPGTFQETAVFRTASFTSTSGSFAARFVIQSGTTVITGSKQGVLNPASLCGGDPSVAFGSGSALFTATITTPTGTSMTAGGSSADVSLNVSSSIATLDEVFKPPPIPAPGPCDVKITGAGRFTADNGDRVSFSGSSTGSSTGEATSNLRYVDHGPAEPLRIELLTVGPIFCTGAGQATFSGTALVNGQGPFIFEVEFQDSDAPGVPEALQGRPDLFRIALETGYRSGEQFLEGGNIKVSTR
jgi:hypothetical protein